MVDYYKCNNTMKKLLFFAAALLLCSACGSNSNGDSQEREEELKSTSSDSEGDSQGKKKDVPECFGWDYSALSGDVKSVTIKFYGLTDKFGEEILGDLRGHYVYHFAQSHGNVTEINMYDTKGKLTEKRIATYDTNGNCTETKYYTFKGPIAVPESVTKYEIEYYE